MIIRKPGFDWGIFFASVALLGCGVVFVYSSSFALAEAKYGVASFFLSRQAIRAALAVVCFAVFINVDYHVWTRQGPVLYGIAIVLLIYVLIAPQSHAIKGARRWISLGFISFQASEFARMALVFFLAKKIGDAGAAVREWKTLMQVIVAIGLMVALIVVEPNFSTAMVVTLLGILMVFVGGARLTHLGAIAAAVVPFGVIGLVAASYRLRRVVAFLNPSAHKDGSGYQTYQAILGLGNGGIFGRGLGQGEQKYFYLPEPHTDFAFSIMGEEIGFVGMALILAVFVFILYRGMRVAMAAPDKTGQLTAFGLTFALGAYVILHGFVNTGLAPTTGVPLPFLSYGGMSLVFTMCGMGVLLNISSQGVANGPASRLGVPESGVASRLKHRGRK